uniref:Uncharacterized protein n=1 Tax=Eutreptiella gymnastica TaxID=73025 RepID=A0A7S4G1Q7_9EUGL
MARATAKKPKASPTPKGKGAVGPPPTKKVQRGGRAAADGRKRPEAKAKRAVSRRTKRKNAEAEVEGKKERKEKGTVKLKANAKATQKATPKPKPKVQPQLKPELTVKRKVGRPRKTELEKAVAAAERRRAKKMTRSERVETAPKKARMPTGEGPEGETRKASRAKKEVPACGGTEKAVEKQSKQPKKLHGYIFNPFEYRGTAPDTLHPYIKVHVFLIADSKGILTTERLMAQGAALVQSLVHHGSTLDVQRDAGMITSFLADCGMKHAMGNTSFCPSLSHTNKKPCEVFKHHAWVYSQAKAAGLMKKFDFFTGKSVPVQPGELDGMLEMKTHMGFTWR